MRARLDLFGVVVLAAVVGLAGGVTRDLLIGVPPETFRDARFLAAVASAGVVCFLAGTAMERMLRPVLVFDAIGLSLFSVTGATKGLSAGLGPVQAVTLGAVTGIGGGILRDVLLREVPVVLRSDLYAVPALGGAAIVVVAHEAGSDSGLWALAGATACFLVRLLGLRYGLSVPTARGIRDRRAHDP